MPSLKSFVVGILLFAAPSFAAEKKLNVLLILSDDLCTDIAPYTPGAAITPNLGALAERGVRFDRLYCQFPLCGPSRASFLSGLRPQTTGVITNGPTVREYRKDLVTLPELFRKHGYFVARAGKAYHLHIPNGVGTSGPDDPLSWDYAYNPPSGEHPPKEDGEEFNPSPELPQAFRRNLLNDPEGKTQADYHTASETIRLLNQNKDKPFFLVCGFIRPHVPEIAPRRFFDLYDISRIILPDNPPNDRDDVPAPAFQYKKPDLGMSRADCVESKRAYYAATSFMDHQVGRVLSELDRLGLRDSTLVVFLSDHGYLLGQHFGWQKTMLWEEVCRVPMIVSYPDMPHRNAAARGLAESVDLYPTVCDLAGVPAPKELEGRSLRQLLEDPASPFKDAAFTMTKRKEIIGRSVRTDRFRYNEWDYGDQGVELYDHQADPHEYVNLAKDPRHADTAKDLAARLHAHFGQPSR